MLGAGGRSGLFGITSVRIWARDLIYFSWLIGGVFAGSDLLKLSIYDNEVKQRAHKFRGKLGIVTNVWRR
jgi:hypothetical protein